LALKLREIKVTYTFGSHVQDMGLLSRGLTFLLYEVGIDLDYETLQKP